MEALRYGKRVVVTEDIVRKIQELHPEALHENLIEQLPRPAAKKIKSGRIEVLSDDDQKILYENSKVAFSYTVGMD
jgi:hypothetical protein